MKRLFCLTLLFPLLLACQQSRPLDPADAQAGPSNLPSPASADAAVPPQSSSEASPVASPKPAPSQDSSAQRPDRPPRFRTLWETRSDRIDAARKGWMALSAGERDKRLQDALRSVMSRHECNTVMGCPAEETLIAAGPLASKAIVDLYPTVERDSYNKYHLLDILGENGDRSAVPLLRTLLSDKQWNARANAAFALGRIADPSTLADLQQTLKSASTTVDQAVEYAAAFAVERLQPGSGRETLLRALQPDKVASINWGYTRYAVQAVGLLGLKQACPALLPSLNHQDVFLRRQAIQTVAALRCGQAQVLEAVAQSLEHPALTVRTEAAEALRAVTRVPIKTMKTWQKYKTNVLKVKE